MEDPAVSADSSPGRLPLTRLIVTAAIGCLAILLAGCSMAPPDDATNARMGLEGQRIRLDAEQVMLTQKQVECGAREDLWEPPTHGSEPRQTAKLLPAARTLQFDDDVTVAEAGYNQPYVQVRGDFPLVVEEVVNVKPGRDSNTRIVQVRAGVNVSHTCLARPLPLMGVRNGKFHQDINPSIEMRVEGDTWKFDRVLH